MKRTMRMRRGLSLLEVLVALAVVAVALFAILASQVGAFQASAQAREIADARDIASRGIGNLRAAVISDAMTAERWLLLRGEDGTGACASPTVATIPAPDYSSTAVAPGYSTTSPCSGQYVEQAADGVRYAVRWALGPPGNEEIRDVDSSVEAWSSQAGMLRVLIRLDWRRRGQERSLAFEDFISCVDVDVTFCPVGNG